MKKIIALAVAALALASLGGCVVYPAHYGYYGPHPYYGYGYYR